jgi:site-specific DNA recombinase
VKTVRKVTRIDGNNALQAFKPKVRVAAYCRVSTDSDEQMASLEAQKDHYESYIKTNPDWEFAGIYYDEGISGTKKENRTGLLRLLADCENKKIDFIITKSVSRFARNTTDCIEMVRKLTDLGVFIYFEKENINTQRMEGELVLTILSSLAENESLSIAENSKWSIRRRFQNGTYKISYPPYGYDYVDGKLFINKEQAEIVKRIFSEALDGKGTQIIADGLNSDKIPTKRGSHWTATTIRGILSNEKYTGDVLLQKTYTDENFKRHYNHGEKDQYMIKDHHEAIISHEVFEAAQEILKQRGKEKGVIKGSSKYQNRYLFSGKIKCAECGSNFKRRIHGSGDRKYIAWCCTKHIKDASACSMKFVREDAIHQGHITMLFKHENVPVLYGVSSDEHPVVNVQYGYTAGGMTGYGNDFKRSVSKVQDIVILDRNDRSRPSSGSIIFFFVGRHIYGFEASVPRNMIRVGMGIEKLNRKRGYTLRNFFCMRRVLSAVNKECLLFPCQQE